MIDVKNNSVDIDREVIPQLQQYPHIELAVPVVYANLSDDDNIQDIITGDYITIHNYIVTNNDFFKLSGLKTIVSKVAEPMADVNSIVLTRSTAQRLYGTTDVLDKVIKKDDVLLTVTGVVEDLPGRSSMSADFFMSENNPDYRINIRQNDAGRVYPRNIFITLNNSASVDAVTQQLNSSFPDNKSNTTAVNLQPISSIYLSEPIDGSYNKTANKSLIWVFVTIALLTLLMSICNYANFTISRQMANLKQSGIRITNGAQRSQIRSFYLTDVSLSVLIAFALSLLIAIVGLPFAESLLDTKLNI